MARDIRPLSPDDLPELSEFLLKGFHATPGADFAAPDVLRWKYLEQVGIHSSAASAGAAQSMPEGRTERLTVHVTHSGQPLSYVARSESGEIVGHLGLCRTHFVGQGIAGPSGRVTTMHIIDWLGSPEQRSIGISMMRQAHQGVETQFGLGVSPSALAVGERAGYELRGLVPVYTRLLRPGYWLRAADASPLKRWLRLARDLSRQTARFPARPRSAFILERVSRFGSEISEIVAATKAHAILTERDPARLNAFLSFPRQLFSGWHLRDRTGCLRGFALLNVVSPDGGRTRIGKIVDCLMSDLGASSWNGAFLALSRELKHQRADVAQCYASTPWVANALAHCGFASRFGVKFHIRDPHGQIPRGATFHLTTLEGDYAYT
jgi:hypothetical protein